MTYSDYSRTADSDGILERGRVPKTSLFLDREDRRSLVYLARGKSRIPRWIGRRGWTVGGQREEEGVARRRRVARRQTGKAGRHQAMDEMLTRRETIDYSRRGRRRKGVVGREMVFLYRSRRQANRSEFIPPAKYVRRVPSRVYPPRDLTDLSRNYCFLCIHRPRENLWLKGSWRFFENTCFLWRSSFLLRWAKSRHGRMDNAPLFRDRSMLTTRALSLSLSFSSSFPFHEFQILLGRVFFIIPFSFAEVFREKEEISVDVCLFHRGNWDS